ncbi:hypothetical protein HNV11_04915 [Spirosoma taeanense]|uniref:Uncharacterized protein n=1 Tax=Spirosoma taeanense TaxID=2735870 RepID=A0A6M5Y267_9BACT|nr:hypothetical protein [Spirosoma taeanense]QJW88768.1 hypothetical protein HNV11_04915 [Spirosoma taeanense]
MTSLKPFGWSRPLQAITKDLEGESSFDFDGIGFRLRSEAEPKGRASRGYENPFAFEAELYVDGQKVETA